MIEVGSTGLEREAHMGGVARRGRAALVGRAVAAAAVLAALALALPACSSDSGSEADALTADELVAQANQICGDAQERLDPQGEVLFGGGQPDPDALAVFHTTLVADLEVQLAQFRELSPPPELADDYAEYLELAAEGIETVRAGGPDGLLSPVDPFAAANTRAAILGFDACVP